jgi:hypothetical protein
LNEQEKAFEREKKRKLKKSTRQAKNKFSGTQDSKKKFLGTQKTKITKNTGKLKRSS